MKDTRSLHRTIAVIVLLFTLHIGLTGALIQMVDLRALLGHAPATSPAMQAIRESIDGNDGFAVIGPADYAQPALPARLDYAAAFATTLNGARAAIADQPISLLELRELGGAPVGQAGTSSVLLRLNPVSGVVLARTGVSHAWHPPPWSLHTSLKWIHRIFSDGYLWINCLAGLGLLLLVGTGSVVYIRMVLARRRIGRTGLFWASTSGWRRLHRSVAVLAAVFLVYIAATGIWLSVDSFMMGRFRAAVAAGRQHDASPAEVDRPLADAAVPAMLRITLDAYRDAHADRPIKALRLRNYAGILQGVVIAGGKQTDQYVFNGTTGTAMTASGPGYPITGFPFGWQMHETLKRLHRGDYFGLSGRVIDMLCGLSLAYLSLSGLVMYYDQWKRGRGKRQGPAAGTPRTAG